MGLFTAWGEMMCPNAYHKLMAELTAMPGFHIHSPSHILLQADEHLKDGNHSLHFCD